VTRSDKTAVPGNTAGIREGKAGDVLRPETHRVLFPVAAIFAALALPLWLAGQARALPFASPAWHGHEMLFGYAAAVAAGFLVTRADPRMPWLLLAAWIAERAAPFISPAPLAFLLGISFPAALLVPALPPLLRGAKRRENRIVPGVLVALLALDALWWRGTLWHDAVAQQRALLAGVDLFALLMLIVGGRALPAAVGGYLERRGIPRRDRIRRGYELPIAALAGGACLLDAFGHGGAAGALNMATAAVTLVRVLSWQLSYARAHPALWALALGYLWLVPGLLLKGLAALGLGPPVTHMLHGITIGALGTLTLTMMARTAVLQARQPLEHFGDIGLGAALVSMAAILRLIAPWYPAMQTGWLWTAAMLWAAAFLVLLHRLRRTPRRRSLPGAP
jgi:uncharacterized protein involved in response to NO